MMTTYIGILPVIVAGLVLLAYILSLLAYILSLEMLSFRCPHWKHCANYEKGLYVCDRSDDEYRHSCYKRKDGDNDGLLGGNDGR